MRLSGFENTRTTESLRRYGTVCSAIAWATRLRGLCAFFEHAHNGLATALRDCVFRYRLAMRLRGLCAFFEHAHNGLATALRDCVFRYRLAWATRLRGLCAFLNTRTTDSLRRCGTVCSDNRLAMRLRGLCAPV